MSAPSSSSCRAAGRAQWRRRQSANTQGGAGPGKLDEVHVIGVGASKEESEIGPDLTGTPRKRGNLVSGAGFVGTIRLQLNGFQCGLDKVECTRQVCGAFGYLGH